jgi:hypothetical protein
MSDNISVRASRDGDQFHYLWAARRCLRLLSATSGLVAITIEGASPSESSTGNAVEAGEELIDVRSITEDRMWTKRYSFDTSN